MAALDAEAARLLASGVHVLVLSFNSHGDAVRWQEDAGSRFPHLTDDNRAVYAALGLPRSYLGSWGVEAISHYADRALHKAQSTGAPAVEQDLQQLGGDFLLSSEGVVQAAWPSTTSQDRPSVAQILEAASAQDLHADAAFSSPSAAPSSA